MTAKRFAAATLKILSALIALGFMALASMLVLLRLDHNTQLVLPLPSGRFAVGRSTYNWVNQKLSDSLAPSPANRSLAVWIWYPAANTNSPATVEYLPAKWRQAIDARSGTLMTGFLTRDLAKVQTHSLPDPPVSPDRQSYPVVILRAGSGAQVTDNTTLAEDLASHGYVVVGFDAPWRTSVVVLPDGQVINRPAENDPENLPRREAQEKLAAKLVDMWSADIAFAIDELERLNNSVPENRFSGRLDLQSIGVIGHSLGGATAAQFCHDDERCKAGIDIDGALYGNGSVIGDGPRRPFMFILSDHGNTTNPVDRQILANIRAAYSRLPPASRSLMTVGGASHFSFTDQALLKSPHLMQLLRVVHVIGPLDGSRGLAITAYEVRTFLDVHLDKAPTARLSDQSRFPEVHFDPDH